MKAYIIQSKVPTASGKWYTAYVKDDSEIRTMTFDIKEAKRFSSWYAAKSKCTRKEDRIQSINW